MANEMQPSKSQPPAPSRTGDVFETMRQEMNRLFDNFDGGWGRFPGSLLKTSGTELAGVKKDVTVTVADGVLTIAGEKKSQREEKKDNYFMSERSFGSFRRALRLPDSIDDNKIEARFEKGVLKIVAAKKPEAVKAEKKIQIAKG
jgi:HSP20 family protein